MFTGIIERMGRVESVTPTAGGLRVRFAAIENETLERGESIAVNGVCLTALPNDDGSFDADLSTETLDRTNLRHLRADARVNLERALPLGGRLSGHIVQGHVDSTGRVTAVDRQGDFATIRWSYPSDYAALVVPKGSVTVNGVSLTVVDPRNGEFSAALIPETLARTTLGEARPGDEVNLEFDIIAKFVRQMVAPYLQSLA